jgi:hypothetical protein
MRLDQRTYVDREGNATTDRRKGVQLLGPAGAIIDDDEAEALGLKEKSKPADKQKAQPENKVLSMPRKTRRKTPITVPKP